MKKIIELSYEEAKKHFLKGSSYFNQDFPDYINFEPILSDVAAVLNGKNYKGFKSKEPKEFENVNYSFLTNKDGQYAWRPLELIHPAIYVSLVNLICEPQSWSDIQSRFSTFGSGVVECCSIPVVSIDHHSDLEMQIRDWWKKIEQRSIINSFKFSHILHTDVRNCYGSLYTHSISWALHGRPLAKERQNDPDLLGNNIDTFIGAGRYGQTNGISQGSVLMDFIAEIVLGYIDQQISDELGTSDDFRILRYRDDYRIFANSDDRAEKILKVISDKLQEIGMVLGVSKTRLNNNVVEGSIKPDKLAGIDLLDLGETKSDTIQKQLLRIHSFGQRFPNSGALRRLVSKFHKDISEGFDTLRDLDVLIAIATDIGFVSPSTFPAIAAILSYLISFAHSGEEQERLWNNIVMKMSRVPYNGYQEIWLQRITKPREVALEYDSDEPICNIVNLKESELWDNQWISSKNLIRALDVSKINVEDPSDSKKVITPKEIELFTENVWLY